MVAFSASHAISATTKVNAPTATTPINCAINNLNPPPKNKPLPVAAPVILSCANNPTAIVPKVPCTK